MEHFLKAVDEITLDDIYNISQKILSSPLTMASYGDGNLLFFTELYDLVIRLDVLFILNVHTHYLIVKESAYPCPT